MPVVRWFVKDAAGLLLASGLVEVPVNANPTVRENKADEAARLGAEAAIDRGLDPLKAVTLKGGNGQKEYRIERRVKSAGWRRGVTR
jgi:hypothetical protein